MKITTVIIHHSAVSYKKNSDQWHATNNYHKIKFKPYENKWKAYKSSLGFYNGYHFEISMRGVERQARKIGETCAATYQQNMNNGQAIHIMLDGNFDIEYPTKEQEKTLIRLLQMILKKYPTIKIKYHRDFANKTCPGKLISTKWIQKILTNSKTMFIKKINNGKIYINVDNKLIHFNTSWKVFAENFENAIVIELSTKEFAKFNVLKNVSVKK